jgi:hypothetical protein
MIALLVAASIAHAQPSEIPAEARERFERGLDLFDEGRYDAALAEFRRAYEIAPSYRILYNLGRVYAETGDSVRSVDALERYFAEGGAAIDRRRRAEVEALLAEQRARVAQVWVRTNVDDAEIAIDGVLVLGADGAPIRTPLTEPIRVTSGRHRIAARAPAHEAAERPVELPGGVVETVSIDLLPLASEEGRVHFETPLRGVTVLVDGREVGVTPIREGVALSPGVHAIEALRPGYITHRSRITLAPRDEVQVSLALAIDPEAAADQRGRLHVQMPDASYSIAIDGEVATGTEIELPMGEHLLELEVADREPLRALVDVPADGVLDYRPDLVWTESAREGRIESAARLRSFGLVGVIGGSVLFFGLGPVFVHSLMSRDDASAELDRLRGLFIECDDASPNRACFVPGSMPERQYDWPVLIAQQSKVHDDWTVASHVAGWLALTGAAMLATGIVLLIETPSDEEIDASARLDLSIGPGSIALTGAF